MVQKIFPSQRKLSARLVFIFYIAGSIGIVPLFAQAVKQPNIIWFVSEDNSPYFEFFGNTDVHTPYMDGFQKESITFTNAFSNAPVCAPSRSTIITGMYATSLGSQHMRSYVSIRDSIHFFPRYLKEQGYFTTLRVKKDYNLADQDGTWDIDDWWNAPDALKGRKPDQPYFLFYNTWMTHEGKIHDVEDARQYFDDTFDYLGTEKRNSLRSEIVQIHPDSIALPEHLPDLPEIRQDLAWYYELMQMLDVEFREFMQQMEALGALDNTIVIYSSDHGGVLARSKRFVYESGLHIPLMIRLPKDFTETPVSKGSVIDKVVSLVDIPSTILELAGIDTPAHMHGKNILSPTGNTVAYGFRGRMDETYDMVRTFRNKKYRYIRNYMPFRPDGLRVNYLWKAANVRAFEQAYIGGGLEDKHAAFFKSRPAEMLFAIENDPDNVRNLAGDKTYEKVLQRFRRIKDSTLLALGDTGFIPEGELWKMHDSLGVTYADYTKELPLKAIMSAAETATLNPNIEELLPLLQSEVSAIRYWGVTGALLLAEKGQTLDIKEKLVELLQDPSGDVAAVASETLMVLGHREKGLEGLAKALDSSNPYVVLRACNTIEAQQLNAPILREKLASIVKRDSKGSFDYAIRKGDYLLKSMEHW